MHKAGGATVPVPSRLGQRHVERVLAASGALCVIASGAVPAGPASPLWTTVGQLEAGQPVDPLEDVGPQDVAEILYTSGTSGVSKGVVASNV
jgi:long-subunit acyl-CoA synthetase (AMP-forming)